MGRPARSRAGRLTHRAPPGRPCAAESAGAASPPCRPGSSPGPGTRTCFWSGSPAWPRPSGGWQPRGLTERAGGRARLRARRPRLHQPRPSAPPSQKRTPRPHGAAILSASRDHVTGGAATASVDPVTSGAGPVVALSRGGVCSRGRGQVGEGRGVGGRSGRESRNGRRQGACEGQEKRAGRSGGDWRWREKEATRSVRMGE